MKRSMCATLVILALCAGTAISQELRVGPTGGALFSSGSRGHGSGEGTMFSFGGEVVYSLSNVPIDLVAQASYAPGGGRGRMRDSLDVAGAGVRQRREGDNGNFMSLGLGGRWMPLRGPVSPYLGASFQLSHQEGGADRRDSLGMPVATSVATTDKDREREFGGAATRFGVGLSVGSEFELSSLLRLDVGASYSLTMPFGRGRDLSTIGFGASLLFNLF